MFPYAACTPREGRPNIGHRSSELSVTERKIGQGRNERSVRDGTKQADGDGTKLADGDGTKFRAVLTLWRWLLVKTRVRLRATRFGGAASRGLPTATHGCVGPAGAKIGLGCPSTRCARPEDLPGNRSPRASLRLAVRRDGGESNGGVDGTRTRGLCRDRAAF